MKITKLTSREQLKALKKGDLLIVEWGECSTARRNGEYITATKIWGINSIDEVIVRQKDNLYFGIDRFIEGTSVAKEVYLVTAD